MSDAASLTPAGLRELVNWTRYLPTFGVKELNLTESYRERCANIGRYGTADWAETPDLPVVVTPASAATASITLTNNDVAATVGFDTVTTVSGTNLFKGAIFNVAGLKIVDCSGIETEVPVQVVVLSANAAGTSGTISPLRIALHGETGNNPNAWVPAGTSSLTLTYALGTSKTYVVNEVRTKDCFAVPAACLRPSLSSRS